MGDLKDKAALVTGASAGLGAAIARTLALDGARVLMCARSHDRLAATASGIAREIGLIEESAGPSRDPVLLAGDLTDPQTAPRLATAAQEQFGGLDILVCNGGGPPAGDFADGQQRFRLSHGAIPRDRSHLGTPRMPRIRQPPLYSFKRGIL